MKYLLITARNFATSNELILDLLSSPSVKQRILLFLNIKRSCYNNFTSDIKDTVM